MTEYIEREAVYEDFEKCNQKNPKWTQSRVKTLIARQKASDVAPVRHGRWIYHHDDLFPGDATQECSCCHEEEYLTLYNENYCPNCGAKMDLEG